MAQQGYWSKCSLKCSCGDGRLCKIVCLDSIYSQFDEVPCDVIIYRGFFPFAIKKIMHDNLFYCFCYKPQDDALRSECFTIVILLIAYNSYFVLLKGHEIQAYFSKNDLLIKLAIECFRRILRKC